MSVVSQGSLRELRHTLRDKKIAFCSGSFDLTHAGHVLFFENCKNYADILVVGIGGDALIQTIKGKDRPIFNEHLRIKIVDSFKPVDFTFIQSATSDGDPLSICLSYAFETLRPDVYIINDDAFDIPLRKQLAKEYGIALIILKRYAPTEFGDISTTNILKKIKGAM